MKIASYYSVTYGISLSQKRRVQKRPSLSVGGHGITTNISGRGVHETFSVPGTGISYRTQNRTVKSKGGQREGCGGCLSLVVLFLIVGSCSSLFAPKDVANNSAAIAIPSPISTPPFTAQATSTPTNTHVNLMAPSIAVVPSIKRQKLIFHDQIQFSPCLGQYEDRRISLSRDEVVWEYPARQIRERAGCC
jgi:hypothetical protein